MDVFDEELIRFRTALNKYAVKYIMAGGVATNLNGYQRTTNDLDVWIEDSTDNRVCLRKAMQECSQVDYFMLETLQIIPGWTPGPDGRSERVAVTGPVSIPFLHINHLIASKKALTDLRIR